jgi:hypothetical protein
VTRLGPDSLLAVLNVPPATPDFAGNYSCGPPSLQPASVTLHVLNGTVGPCTHTKCCWLDGWPQQQQPAVQLVLHFISFFFLLPPGPIISTKSEEPYTPVSLLDIDGSPGELLSWAGRPNTQDSIKRFFFLFLFLSVRFALSKPGLNWLNWPIRPCAVPFPV